RITIFKLDGSLNAAGFANYGISTGIIVNQTGLTTLGAPSTLGIGDDDIYTGAGSTNGVAIRKYDTSFNLLGSIGASTSSTTTGVSGGVFSVAAPAHIQTFVAKNNYFICTSVSPVGPGTTTEVSLFNGDKMSWYGINFHTTQKTTYVCRGYNVHYRN